MVFGSTGMVLAVASVFWAWTNPAQLRQTVLTTLMERVPGIGATLEGASMRLLGGITLLGLRVSRSDDLDKSDFFYVPRAVLYHDKEQLIDGKLAIRSQWLLSFLKDVHGTLVSLAKMVSKLFPVFFIKTPAK